MGKQDCPCNAGKNSFGDYSWSKKTKSSGSHHNSRHKSKKYDSDSCSSASAVSTCAPCGKSSASSKSDGGEKMLCQYFPTILEPVGPTEQFPRPAACNSNAIPCIAPGSNPIPACDGSIIVPAVAKPVPLPIFLLPNQGPDYRVSPAEVYKLKAGARDTCGYAEIFELYAASGFQSFYAASLQSDAFFFVAQGDFNYQVNNLSSTLVEGSTLFVHKGTPFGLTKNTPGPGVILGVYLPPGTLGYYVENALARCPGIPPMFDGILPSKYSLVTGYGLDYSTNIFCQKWIPPPPCATAPCAPCKSAPICPPKCGSESSSDSSSCSSESDNDSDCGGKSGKNKLSCTLLPGSVPPAPPAPIGPTSRLPTPEFPFVKDGFRHASPLPFRNPIVLGPGAGPVYVVPGGNPWTLKTGAADDCGYGEFVTVTILPANPIAGTFANSDIFVYTLTDTLTLVINGATFTAAPRAFAYIPKGTPFAIGSASLATLPTALIGFIPGTAVGYFKGVVDLTNSGQLAQLPQLQAAFCFTPYTGVLPIPTL